MNTAQITGILRIVLPSILTFAVGKGWLTQDTVTQIGSVLAAIVAAGGWSAVSNSAPNLARSTVASAPGVTVHVGALAPPELQKVAADPTELKIVRS